MTIWMCFFERWIHFAVRFAVERVNILCRDTDVPIRMNF